MQYGELPISNAYNTHQVPGPLAPIGFGTYKVDPEHAADLVALALEVGYRHIDTAQMYQNEKEVGQGIARAGVSRSEIFLTTKLNDTNHAPEKAIETFEKSLDDLGVDYVDLFLIHWPLPEKTDPHFVKIWEQMLKFRDSGRARAVGVSNFEVEHLQALQKATGELPALNQIELHPSFLNAEVAAFCKDNGILVECWSPLGRGEDLSDPTVIQVAQELSATPAQVALASLMARGYSVIPKSSSRARMEENLAAADLALSPEQLQRLADIDRGEEGRMFTHPNNRN